MTTPRIKGTVLKTRVALVEELAGTTKNLGTVHKDFPVGGDPPQAFLAQAPSIPGPRAATPRRRQPSRLDTVVSIC